MPVVYAKLRHIPMAAVDRWFAGPRRPVGAFALLLLVPAAAVVWLVMTSLAQECELERRQIHERRALAADRLVAELAQAVVVTEHQLIADPGTIGPPSTPTVPSPARRRAPRGWARSYDSVAR